MKELEIVESKAFEYLFGYIQCLEDFLKEVKEREIILRSEIHEEEDNFDEKMIRINECHLIIIRIQQILLGLIKIKEKKNENRCE